VQLGWIDFSKEERNQLISILQKIGTQTAVDELGIGAIRDAFSNILFPGISTLQTRAKYFVLIPYIFSQAETKSFQTKREAMQYIHSREDELVKVLIEQSKKNELGIIGRTSFHQGKTVKLKPSSIYWSGLQTMGILRKSYLSKEDVCGLLVSKNRKKDHIILKMKDDDGVGDDTDAAHSELLLFDPVGESYDFMKEAKIALTYPEANYLERHFIKSTKGSLLEYMIREKDVSRTFQDVEVNRLPEPLASEVALAKVFSGFIYTAYLLYNIIYAEGCGETAAAEELRVEFDERMENYHPIDLDSILEDTACTNRTYTVEFLRAFDRYMQVKDENSARALVIQREKQIKGNRAKLNRPEQYAYSRVHQNLLDYRYGTARQIVMDILEGLEDNDGKETV